MKFYEYKACSTCQRAAKFLAQNEIKFERIAIVEQPPTVSELKEMLSFVKATGGSLKNLFNTSGERYRALGIADQLKAGMTEAKALELLSQNGKLIKRPFLLGADFGTVGFKEKDWRSIFEL